MLEKDLKLFWRDRRTLLLVILAPIIIMFVLSNIFNVPDTRQSIKGISIGVCNMDSIPLDMSTDVFNVVQLSGNCVTEAQTLVEQGEFRFSVLIPPNFHEDIRSGRGSALSSFIDNSKGQIALVSSAAMKGFVADLNEQIGTTFILEAWKSLRELNENLKTLIGEMDKGIGLARNARTRAQQLNVSIEEVNLTEVGEQLILFEIGLEGLAIGLEEAHNLVSFASTPVNVSGLTVPSPDVTNLQLFYSTYCTVGFAGLNGTIYANATYEAWKTMCVAVNESIDQVVGLNASASAVLSSVENATAGTRNTSTAALDTLADLQDNVQQMQSQVNVLYEAYDDLLELRSTTRGEIFRFYEELEDYEKQMTDLRNNLEKTTLILNDYTSRDPQFIIRAVSLIEHKAFEGRKVLSFMQPGIIALILLFITMFISSSVIVSERRGGTMARNFLSPISVFFFLVEKSVYLLLLAAIQLGSISLVSLFLDVPLSWSWSLALVLLVVCFSFIAIGMLVGALSQTENTALLTCLVLGLPMMFLSGVFFPFEIMPSIMRTIGGYLPLTLATSNLDRILVYGLPILGESLLLLFGISFVLFVLAVLLIRRNPMAN